MTIFLDGELIFKGEIAKACGGIMGGVDAFGDVSSAHAQINCPSVIFHFLDYFVYCGRRDFGEDL